MGLLALIQTLFNMAECLYKHSTIFSILFFKIFKYFEEIFKYSIQPHSSKFVVQVKKKLKLFFFSQKIFSDSSLGGFASRFWGSHRHRIISFEGCCHEDGCVTGLQVRSGDTHEWRYTSLKLVIISQSSFRFLLKDVVMRTVVSLAFRFVQGLWHQTNLKVHLGPTFSTPTTKSISSRRSCFKIAVFVSSYKTCVKQVSCRTNLDVF